MSFGESISDSNTMLLMHMNGSSVDSSGNSYTITDNNISYGKQYGRFNEGALFNNALNPSIKLENNANFNLSTFTILMNFKVTDFTNIGQLISKWKGNDNANQNYFIDAAGTGNKLRFGFSTSTTTFALTTINKALSTGVQYNLCVAAGGGTALVYINGELINTISYTGTISTNSHPLIIGARWSSLNYTESFFNGSIDEVKIKNIKWTTQDYQKYYTNSLGRF